MATREASGELYHPFQLSTTKSYEYANGGTLGSEFEGKLEFQPEYPRPRLFRQAVGHSTDNSDDYERNSSAMSAAYVGQHRLITRREGMITAFKLLIQSFQSNLPMLK